MFLILHFMTLTYHHQHNHENEFFFITNKLKRHKRDQTKNLCWDVLNISYMEIRFSSVFSSKHTAQCISQVLLFILRSQDCQINISIWQICFQWHRAKQEDLQWYIEFRDKIIVLAPNLVTQQYNFVCNITNKISSSNTVSSTNQYKYLFSFFSF